MKSIRACANRTGLLLSILLSAGAGWAQSAAEPASAPASQPASVLKPGDHILFIGDSITGLGDREITTQSRDTEFVPLIRQALAATHKDSKFELVTLGASGSTVGAWLNFFARAADPKQKEFTTDVPQFGVKATLARNWDVVIIMLGMNDVLQPAVNDDKESLANWDASYARLVQTVRDRVHPRVVALAQCTMASEDPNAAMNKFVDKLNEHVAATAKKADCVFLETDIKYKLFLTAGRMGRSDFHVTYDFIHPTAEGQAAIAEGMLQGLGDNDSLMTLTKNSLGSLLKPEKETSYTYQFCSAVPGATFGGPWGLYTVRGEEIPNDISIKICQRRGSTLKHLSAKEIECPSLKLIEPEGWKGEVTFSRCVFFPGGIAKDSLNGIACFDLVQKPDSIAGLKTTLAFNSTWNGQKKRLEVPLPAPWLITAGPVYFWADHKFDEKAARTAIDDAIEAGKDLTGPIDVVMHSSSDGNPQPNTTGKLTWHRFFPSVDYTGGDAPGNVDFWSISYPHVFETGYAARWVWSEKDRPVRLVASSKGFTRGTYMQVWVNGKKEYGGEVSEEKDMKKEFAGSLKKGWNCVAFRCCHRSYFFQSDLEMLGVEKDNLEDLRFSVVPKNEKSPAPTKP